MKNKKIVSIIIPAFNEEKIIQKTVQRAVEFLTNEKIKGEVMIVENGSTDKTLSILKKLEKKYSKLKVKNIPEGNKGLALKKGMLESVGDFLILIDADLWDSNFVKSAILLLNKYDVVVGSKVLKGSKDDRSGASRAMSYFYNLLFKLTFGFKGTETHAKLAFRRGKILPLIKMCKTDGLVFDTELIIRAERANLKKMEIPTSVVEIRPRTFSVSKQLKLVIKSYLILINTLGVRKMKLTK